MATFPGNSLSVQGFQTVSEILRGSPWPLVHAPSAVAGLLLSQPLINSSLRPLIWPLGFAECRGFAGVYW